MALRTESGVEQEGNYYPYRVHIPTAEHYTEMCDRLIHGEVAFNERYPSLCTDYELVEFLGEHPEALEFLAFDHSEGDLERFSMNVINELLAGPKQSLQDFIHLKNRDIWHERDKAYLDKVVINDHGCWEMPKYVDHIKPNRARYPQPRTYSRAHGDVRQQMGAAWMWERIIGPIPDDKLPNGRRAFWPDHRCNNKSCVYPRHVVLGKPQANDAFTARMDMMSDYLDWMTQRWARPSFGYPEGLTDIVDASEVQVLSERSVMLPPRMSKREFDACVRALGSATHLPDGGYTTDPGYHVLMGAIKKGLDFDDATGCWIARFDLDILPPHRKTISHACGNNQCCNIRHMDIAESQKRYYEIPAEQFITLPDGYIVNTESGEKLPSYWDSWLLYWNWLKKYSASPSPAQELELADEPTCEEILSEADFSHIWVHPLSGCWENDHFYPRWTANGNQANAYGFHRSTYGEYGRSTHRYLLHKYLEYIGEPQEVDRSLDADHRCNNRRCCNPLHMQFTDKESHRRLTYGRSTTPNEIGRIVAQRVRLRNLGRR